MPSVELDSLNRNVATIPASAAVSRLAVDGVDSSVCLPSASEPDAILLASLLPMQSATRYCHLGHTPPHLQYHCSGC